MKKLFPRILGFIVIIVTLALAPTISTTNLAIQTEARTGEAHSQIVTGDNTSAGTALTWALYNADVGNVSSVSSNEVETPVVGTYTTAIRWLTFTSLTANTTRTLTLAYTAAENLTNLTGMEAVAGFGAPLIILALLVGGGIFAIAGARGKLKGASVGDMLAVIGSVIVVIVSLTLFESVIDYSNTLIGPTASGFGDVIYGVIPLVIYVGIIAAAGYVQVRTYGKLHHGSRASSGY